MPPTLAAGGHHVDPWNSVVVVGDAHPQAADSIVGRAATVVAEDRLPVLALLAGSGGLIRSFASAGGRWGGDHERFG